MKNDFYIFQIIPSGKGAFFAGCPVQIRLPDLPHQLAVRHDLEGLPQKVHIFGDRFMDDVLKLIHLHIRHFTFCGSHTLSLI
jgi:hypothetical protein